MIFPTTKKEMEALGWDYVDVVLFSGDAFVDHPSFGAAVVARVLEAEGLRVAVVPQPGWRDDLRDFKKMGVPRLFFAISGGSMDSMVNHYTAARRLRSTDAYTPEGRAGARPDRAVTVYSRILKQLYPDVPLVIGGIEASQRRFTHYDYWSDSLMPSILVDSQADLLIYGMGEKPLQSLARQLLEGIPFEQTQVRQTVRLTAPQKVDILLHSHEECLKSKYKQAENFGKFERETNRRHSDFRIGQAVGQRMVVSEPPFDLLTTEELDAIYELPYTRRPHPRYKGKTIPAFEMIKHSVTLHRGCFGGCSYCTISAHQGKFIASRSKASVVREVQRIAAEPDFKGYISDLGGPSANMYRIEGKDLDKCAKCPRPSCLHPAICPNLNTDFGPLLEVYRAVDALPGIKKSFVGSGIRYDLVVDDEYARELITKHVSGRLKVAPEHTEDTVLNLMRKPSFECFERFARQFDRINREAGLNQQLIPYFISSHPGCTIDDMASLAVKTKRMHFKLEQVQDFTPTPMTLSTEMYYTGFHPLTLQRVYCAHKPEDKQLQRHFFFWYMPESKKQIVQTLKRLGKLQWLKRVYS
ncbi:MAG: YgiQ family radical SAM protein [Paludibacteraceae bacterium]|nr:YgiQ family radical SAM protein [Paludibacteraceae bacterium]